MTSPLTRIIQDAHGKDEVKLKFLNRLDEGNLTRSENPASHFCVYFAAIDPTAQKIFMGLHKKSGLWLCNGGHMDPGETPVDTVLREAQEDWGVTIDPADMSDPELVTLTEIEHPERQICEWHYDMWYFLPFSEATFFPDPDRLKSEFLEYGWYSYAEAQKLLKDPASFEALNFLMQSFENS